MSISSLVLAKVATFLAGAGAGAWFAIVIYGAVQGGDTPSWILPAGIVLAVVGAVLQYRLHKSRGDSGA
ncbi:MAG: hypothetical protein OXG44_18550 [Gammaproteobacteria bacterium]|nr:hypothetical protein [Gammaproteobacteria bacterium]